MNTTIFHFMSRIIVWKAVCAACVKAGSVWAANLSSSAVCEDCPKGRQSKYRHMVAASLGTTGHRLVATSQQQADCSC